MNEEELDAKFSYLVTLRAGERKANELREALKGIDAVSNVADIMVQLELPEVKLEDL